jgi:hypothetical protein
MKNLITSFSRNHSGNFEYPSPSKANISIAEFDCSPVVKTDQGQDRDWLEDEDILNPD